MAVPATEAKKGQVLKLDDKYYIVLDYQLVTPGNKRGFIQFKLKDIAADSVQKKKIGSDDAVELIFLSKDACEYLYDEGDYHVFMNLETYDQVRLSGDVLTDVLPYLVHNQEVIVQSLEGTAINVELPPSVVLEVKEAEPAARGNTAQGVTKSVVLETGLQLNAPHFIEAGEKIKVDTRNGEFMGRAT